MGAPFAPRAKEGFDPMKKRRGTNEQRELRSIARSYKRRGYKVTIPEEGGANLPDFLKGFAPDLIAESENDRVIIEVKQSGDVLGSNELQSIAAGISREPGWRFELATVPSVKEVSLPAPDQIKLITEHARKAISYGLLDVAYAYASSVLEVLVNDLALKHGLKVSRKPITQVARDLVSRGVIRREALHAIERGMVFRHRLVHDNIRPSAKDVEEVLSFTQSLRDELSGAAA